MTLSPLPSRTPFDGKPFYCVKCNCRYEKFTACEQPDCQLESNEAAKARVTVPDRLSTQEGAPHFKGKKLASKLRVMFNGTELKNSVIEYCISKGWVRVLVVDGNTGKAMLNVSKTGLATKLMHGQITVWKDDGTGKKY